MMPQRAGELADPPLLATHGHRISYGALFTSPWPPATDARPFEGTGHTSTA
ncbi:MAG: hypothetical protein OXH52_08285 [Gammaproteobacteria bacterium]|nr:hypothetical protein [Gammaproteobacteria bacterium]